jgi:ketosteroid isomerase-like protein
LAQFANADVETLRRFYELWNSGDADALTELFDADAQVRPALSAFLATTLYRGRDGIAAWYAETNEPWTDLIVEPKQIIAAGERVLGVVRLTARSPGAHVDVETEIAHIATMRKGLIFRLDGYEEPSAALEELGVEGLEPLGISEKAVAGERRVDPRLFRGDRSHDAPTDSE